MTLDNNAFLKQFLVKLQGKESNYCFMQNSLKDQEKLLNDLRVKHKEILSRTSLDIKSVSAVQLIFDKVSDSGFRFLEDLINQGLMTVYPSQPMTCIIKTGIRGKEKTVDFLLQDSQGENPLTECGGGPQEIIALILRVYYIVKNNLRRVIFLDESFTAISGVQLAPLMDFLNSLVTNLGFDFIIITHNNDIADGCSNVYEMFRGNLTKKESEQ